MAFQKLTPKDDIKIDIYEEALNYVFQNNDICNVAVSGPYSAGKSSVIETYKKRHTDKSFLHISLADFETSPEGELQEPVAENLLEGKILNQLIQQIDPSKIPQSNFRIKRPHAFYKKGLFAFGCTVFTLLIFYVIYFSKWIAYVANLPDGWMKSLIELFSTNQVSRLLGMIAIIVLAVLGIYTLINIQLNKGLVKKLSVQGNEIEIFANDDESYFDKYLNEVLYLFEKSGADVFVFEDIDRYNSVKIFQRLREINTLVNRKQNKTIRFFYLLRDDIFVSKDRTKFFDFIIPVVPVVDSSNSYNVMIEMFIDQNGKNLFDPDFLQGISLYIDDMRILKNIYNEYMIYHRRIGTTDQDANKLLAVIIYKNIFPRDFSELQLNRGYVYRVFRNKEKYIEKRIRQIDSEIVRIKSEIDDLNSEILKDKTEINRLYEHLEYYQYKSRSYGLKTEYEQEKQERLKRIEEKTPEKLEALQKRIEELQKEKSALYDKKLSEIITRENSDSVFIESIPGEYSEDNDYYQDIIHDDYFDLLKYLIRNGHIDETYQDYMSYFYENSLSIADKKFLRSITDQKAKDYRYQLTNPKQVVKRLRTVDFSSEEIRNYDLLDYLLREYRIDHVYVSSFMNCLKDLNSLDFIFGYIEREKETEPFVKALCLYWSGVFDAVEEAPEYSPSQRRRLALLMICYADDALTEVDKKKTLSGFINHDADFLSVLYPDIDFISVLYPHIDFLSTFCSDINQIIQGFISLGIKFVDINFMTAESRLLLSVYQHNMYVLNQEMIFKILEKIYKIEKYDGYYHKNLSLIRTQKDSPLCEYIESCMDDYIEQYVGFCNGSICDDEDTVVWLLNHPEVSDDSKSDYLDCLSVKIDRLEEIEEYRWKSTLLSKDLAVCSTANIIDCFESADNQYDDVLIGFINRNELPSGFAADFRSYQSSQQSDLFGATVKCNDLEDEQYKKLIKDMNWHYRTFSIKGISDSKIRILIDLNVVQMNESSLQFLRKEYPDQVVPYIVKNIKAFCDNVIDDEIIDMDETVALLGSSIRLNYKLKMLKYTSDPISVCQKGYPDKLVIYILNHNFDEEDLPELLVGYDTYSSECQAVILQLLVANIETVMNKEYSVSYKLMSEAITRNLLRKEELFLLFSFSVSKYNLEQIKYCLSCLSQEEFLSLFEGKHPKFEGTAANKHILDVLQQNQWISSYSVDGDGYRAYPKK